METNSLFKICARTVLELGAELISSDVIAFYELIKNAFERRDLQPERKFVLKSP